MNTINGVYKSNIAKFNTYQVAMEYGSELTPQGYRRGVFHGDDGLYWVVSGAKDINRLAAANYEKIN